MADDTSAQVSEKKIFARLIDFFVANFLRLTIANKLMLGFSSLLVLFVIISFYALSNLNQLNSINDSVLLTDQPVILASDKMIDLVFAEELYTRRYMIFRNAEVIDIFWRKKAAFDDQIKRIEAVPERRKFPVEALEILHKQYIRLLLEGTESAAPPASSMSDEYDEKIKVHQKKFIAIIQAMAAGAQRDQNKKTAMTASIGSIAFRAAVVLCVFGLILSLTAATLITRNISGAIRKLGIATEMIAKGNFDYEPDISNTDELGDLAEAFVTMAARLKHLEEMHLDTSPLTRLPGGTSIESEMNKRIDDGALIAFCLMDLDNFKAYNDHYGYARGNDLIQAAASIVSQAVADHGSADDFIGHIGGDDFVVITSPENCSNICQAVCDNFDKVVPDFYTVSDRERGHITGENRQGEEMAFPLATISIAVVTNEKNKRLNHIQFGEAAAEMKEHAKAVPGSVFRTDQRNDNKGSKKDRKTKS